MNTAPKVQVRRLMQQAEKNKNERHHTYATFLFRDVRQVSQLTKKSNVTKKVHESGMTSCTAQKRATGLRNHTSVKQRTRSKSSRHGMYRTTVTKSRYTVANSPLTSMIPITQGGSAFNVFDLERIKETCCAAYITSPCAQHRALPAQTSPSEELIQTVHWSHL